MTKSNNDSIEREKLQDEVKGAVEKGQDIKKAVRRITVKALTEGKLDTESIRSVATAVVNGAGMGAASHGSEVHEILGKAISGLDEALSRAAEASRLALEEAAGRGDEYSSHDIKRTLDDLQGLEELFVETLRDAAQGSKNQVSIIFHDLADHAQLNGTVVGRQLKEGFSDLVKQVADVSKTQLGSRVDSVKTTGSLLAKLASGMLEGIADSLQSSVNDKGRTNKKHSDNND